MRYLRLYEEFRTQEIEEIKIDRNQELSDTTIDDVLSPDFFKEEDYIDELSDDEVSQDSRGVYQIKNWKVY